MIFYQIFVLQNLLMISEKDGFEKSEISIVL